MGHLRKAADAGLRVPLRSKSLLHSLPLAEKDLLRDTSAARASESKDEQAYWMRCALPSAAAAAMLRPTRGFSRPSPSQHCCRLADELSSELAATTEKLVLATAGGERQQAR